jgi:tetrahydromethanopterin S-methyltransferase subunit A
MLVDGIGTSEIPTIARHVAVAAERVASLPSMAMSETAVDVPSRPTFKRIAAGGHREPIGYDPRGFFIITLDTNAGEIVCRQYSVDHAPAHEIRSHSAERILLGLLRADLVYGSVMRATWVPSCQRSKQRCGLVFATSTTSHSRPRPG